MIGVPHNKCFKSIREFQLIKESTLGSGSFGVVQLARHRTTCRMYAIKVISSIPSETEARLIQRQIQLHSEVDHPHLIKLWDTLLEDGKIYMIMEYAEGGNLFYHQNTKTIFTQPQAYRFFSQTLDGVSYLHHNDIIHRDLKPENLLLDSEANIKICDFGWAARDIHSTRSTFCGTYEYMAPQMLFRGVYDYRVDIWALGVLLYELLHGYAPFKGKTATEVQESMMNGGYVINSRLSQEVQDLISTILQTSAEKRLSLQRIRSHPWMNKMENLIQSYLQVEDTRSPKQIYPKICRIPTLQAKPKISQHKKNGSLNIDATNNNLHTEVADYISSKQSCKYYSQQRDIDKQKQTPKGNVKASQLFKDKPKHLKNQKGEVDLQRMLQKMRGKKSIKGSKELLSFQKQSTENPFVDVSNRKKLKNNKSDVDVLAQKYPVRFQTEAHQQDWEHRKLKKSHMNGKLLGLSRSVLKFQKSKVQLKF